ncbi:MAG: flagellar basal body P-ring formation protein FlgA [Gemmatimonadetes bacterium]|jgi:flagellar basal body P-ring formation protein FlgA|nr:flagellar basal body P-ring formation protein FlgA [Gemmatimonadota bacterium]
MKTVIICLLALLLAQTVAADRMLSVEEIHRAVEAFVQAGLEGELEADGRIEVRTRWQHDIPLEADGDVAVQVRRLSSRPLRGPVVLKVGVMVGGRIQKEMSITADIRHFGQVLVADIGLRRGEELASEAVVLAERDITKNRDGFFTDPSELEELRMRRAIRPGNVLTRRHVEPVPVVQRGEEITLLAGSAHLQISLPGEAMQDGGIGERIRVRNPASGKVLYGEVVDSKNVLVGI